MQLLGCASTEMSYFVCEAEPGKLPARFRWKEIAIARADVGLRRHTRTSAQHHLAAHEFSVIFAERTLERCESRIAEIRARCPFPTVAPNLAKLVTGVRRGRG